MASLRIGAAKLGLVVRWEYAFVPQGSTLTPLRGCVCLDVGNKAVEGILDTHAGDTGAESTAQLVFNRPELFYEHLLGPYLDRAEAGENLTGTPVVLTVVTHLGPDFDSVVSTLLVQELVENGAFSGWARALVEYATEVDQGRYGLELVKKRPKPEGAPADGAFRELALTTPVHAAHLAVQNLPGLGDDARLARGLSLVRATAEAVAAGPNGARAGWNFHAFQPGADFWRREVADAADGRKALKHVDLVNLLTPDFKAWNSSVSTAERCDLELPLWEGGTFKVRALLLDKPTDSVLHKYWCRADGYPYFVCPSRPDPENPRVYRRVVLSLDPHFRIDAPGEDEHGRRPTLRGLGYLLEQEETKAREAGGGRDERVPVPRWDDGSCDNEDPWYDGRAFDFTIVDAPRSGSRVPYKVVTTAAKSRFWEPSLRGAIITTVRHDVSARGRRGGTVNSPPGMAPGQPYQVSGCDVMTFKGAEVRLDELLPWLLGVLKPGADDGSPSARVRIEGAHSHPFWPLDSVVNGLSTHFGVHEPLPNQEVHFAKGLVWAVRRVPHLSSEPERRRSSFQEVAAADLCLGRFRSLTTRAVNARPGVFGAMVGTPRSSKTRHEFLRFRVGGMDLAVGADAASAALYGHLRILERADRIKAELDELAGIEAATSEKVLEALMASVSVAGVAQTVIAWFDMGRDPSPLFWACLAGSTLVPVVIAGVLISRRSGNGG